MDAFSQDRSILRDTGGTLSRTWVSSEHPRSPPIRPDGCDLLQPAACVCCAAVHLKQEDESQNSLLIMAADSSQIRRIIADADQENGWSAIKNELSEEQTVLKSQRQQQTCEIVTRSVFPSTLKVKGFVFY